MESKPFSIQAPEQIAKDYGGNKQRIAEAMQMGIVDPTAGTLAGMFIDRMRSAQMQEMAQQPTVAQQVMGGAPAQAPLAPAGGLGATAPAGPPMAPAGPPMAGPPMNATPPMDAMPPMGAPPMDAAPPMAEAPMGMAEGGIAALPVPDYMFDEPQGDGYAPGGIVAFSDGGDITVTGRRPPTTEVDPTRGLGKTYEEQMEIIKQYAPQKNKYGTKLTEFYEAEMTPEAQAKRKKQDMWSSLAELGFGMAASKSPTFFGAVGEAGMRAAPAIAERAKERRAEQREMIKGLAAREDVSNKQALEAFGLGAELQKAYAGLLDAKAARDLQERLNKADNTVRLLAARIAAGPGYAAAYAPTGLERIIERAQKDPNYAKTLKDLGVYGGKSSSSSSGNGWGTPEVVD